MEYGHGIAFWIGYMSFNYMLLAIVTLNLYDFILHRSLYYRKQGIIIIIAGFSPWTASILYLTGANPVAGLDLVPISMIISGSLFAYSIFYYRFLDLVPVARKTLVETLPDGILAIDEFDRIQEINHAAINFLGIKQKDILGQTLDACGAEVKPLFQALTNTLTNDQISLEETGKTYSVLHQPIHNQPGSRLVIIRDITEQVESIRKIGESDAKFRKMFRMFRLMADNMPDLLWAKNLNKDFIFVNKAMCDVMLKAVDTDEPLGKSDLYFSMRERAKHQDNPDWHTFGELCQDTDDTVIRLEKPQQFDEFGNVCGQFMFLDVNKAPIIDESGTMIGVVGSARDITKQKENETEIQRKDQLLDAITKATALLIQGEIHEKSIVGALEIIGKATSADRSYIFKNNPHPVYKLPVLSMLYEWTNGKFSSQIENPEMQCLPFDELGESWYNMLSTGSVINGLVKDLPNEIRNIFEAQEVKSALIAPVFINSTFWGVVGFDDCTVGRLWSLTEEHLLAAAANTIGAAYLRKIHREELIAAKDKAEESDRLKSAFLANMSHEIRTPMNGILGFAELLKEPGLSGEEQKEYISIIEKSGARMLNIINDIVDISKIESGQMEIYFKETDINTQIQYIHSFFTPETETKKINFNYHNTLFSNESIITTDREKLYAILTNLVKNSIKYTKEGSIDFGYKLKDSMLEFFVSDTGIGVPKNRQEAIFERFVQADIADKKAMQGAG
ncbi:MAG: histidine kinase dimerization/phospho-acceptor domain-containing protein, partial [Bacteroidales bacterium]